jgi:hypothetical protein
MKPCLVHLPLAGVVTFSCRAVGAGRSVEGGSGGSAPGSGLTAEGDWTVGVGTCEVGSAVRKRGDREREKGGYGGSLVGVVAKSAGGDLCFSQPGRLRLALVRWSPGLRARLTPVICCCASPTRLTTSSVP